MRGIPSAGFWIAEGRLAHYMDYRLGYLTCSWPLRALRDRHAAAAGLLWGYGAAAARREPRWRDDEPARTFASSSGSATSGEAPRGARKGA